MADRLAVVIAVETYQDAAVGPAAHAEAAAAAFARALEALGFARDQQVVLLGSQATKTAVESRLRRLAKEPPDAEALYVYYAGHGFAHEGKGYLACYDSQADDLAETSIPLQKLLDTLKAAGADKVALFLDAGAGLPAVEGPLPGAALQKFFAAPGRACFASCAPGEGAHASGALKHGVWAYHLLQALTGKAPLALEEGRLLTAASLQEHLQRELPRTLRTTFRDSRVQTPRLYAAADRFLVADVGPAIAQGQAVADPRLQQLKRAALRAEETAKVKGLSGFRKFHQLPKQANAWAQKFVADLAAEDVKGDVDARYAAVREYLGYKRRDVEASTDRGCGFVRTPDFEYGVRVELDAEDPTEVVWRREVSGIRTPEVVLGKPFRNAFGDLFDTLVFEFAQPFDLQAWVDRVEEETPEGVKLRCAADCTSCDLTVAGFAGTIRLTPDRVEVRGGRAPTSRGLVEAFLEFQDLFAGGRDRPALPLGPGANDR